MAEISDVKSTIWAKIIQILAKIFGLQTIPPEVTENDTTLTEWWQIYRCKAPWLDQSYVTVDGKKRQRRRLQLGMGKIVCAEMAGLVLAEAPDVDAGELVDTVIEKEKLWDSERRSLEYQGALGAQVLKICLGKDRDGKDTIGLDYVKAQNFIPLAWDNDMVYEGSFLDRRVIAGKPFVRVETHRRARPDSGNPEAPTSGYVITNKAYNEETQIEVPLDKFGEGIEPEIHISSEKPLFAYIRNPEANNINPESPTGISIFANATDTLHALDVAFDQFYSEVELGGRRIALPGTVFRKYVEHLDDGTSKQISYFDPSDRVFLRLEGDDAEKFKPSDLTFDIRSEQFKGAIQTMLDILAMQTGFDAGYFSFDGTSVKTATEVISENSHTYKTMAGFRDNLDAGLKHIFTVINELGKTYNIPGATDKEVTIAWDDSVIEDRTARMNYYSQLYQNGLLDLESALVKIHHTSKEDAVAMAAKIKGEKKTVGADALFGTGS